MRTPFYDAVRHTTDLEVFDWGIHLGPISRAVSLVVPVWEATYDELGVIRPVVFGHRRHISTLRFFLQREESQWVLFRTRDIEAVMGALEGAGARVSRDIERVYRLDPVRPRPAH